MSDESQFAKVSPLQSLVWLKVLRDFFLVGKFVKLDCNSLDGLIIVERLDCLGNFSFRRILVEQRRRESARVKEREISAHNYHAMTNWTL